MEHVNSERDDELSTDTEQHRHLQTLLLYLLPRFNHAGSVGQDVDVFVFMVLVDLRSRLEEGLHEQVQKGRHSDLKTRKVNHSG